MSIILTFVALGCGTNLGEFKALVLVVPFKTLAHDVVPSEGVWVLNLLN